MDFLSSLNQKQKKIVISDAKITLVVAGPGTGKTKTLTAKVAYLVLNKLLDPNSILALTFTQKAASEIGQRLKIVLPEKLPLVTTIHSFCFNQLRSNLGIRIISDKQKPKILNKIINQSKVKINSKELDLIISQYKNLKNDLTIPDQIKDLIELYQDKLKQYQLLDYDDLLLKFLDLLIKEIFFLEDLQKQYKFILIDEFQDISPLQYQIIKKLIGDQTGLFMIGDPLQSIYGFRAASEKIFDQIKSDFPSVYQEKLTINYRSFAKIVSLSNSLFKPYANLNSFYQQMGEVKVIETLNEISEAELVINFISQKMGGMDLNNAYQIDDNIKFSDFGILFRTHYLSKSLEKEFIKSGMPFKLGGEVSIFKQPEIEFLSLVLKFLSDKTETNFNEILNSQYLDLPLEIVSILSLEHLATDGPSVKDLNKRLVGIYNQLSRSINLSVDVSLPNLVGYLVSIWKIESDPKDPISPLNQFLEFLVQFENSQQPLEGFVEYLDNIQSHDYIDSQSDKVSLLTIHSAKGLEFKYLFIIGF